MSEIVETSLLAPDVKQFRILAPKIAAKQRPGQFVIVRLGTDGERIPLTIAGADPDAGTITLIVQAVGRTTTLMQRLDVGDEILDVVGPLGTPSEIDRFGTVAVVGGGVGTAVAYPTAVALADSDNTVIGVVGARSAASILLEDDLRSVCDELHVCTEDGSRGRHGLVTDVLADVLDARPLDRVLAAGPVVMMEAVAALTRTRGIVTIASLNPIMVDGTGMCGGCRVSVGGENRFACLDGPDFDAHLVDFGLLARRNRAYTEWEADQMAAVGACGTEARS